MISPQPDASVYAQLAEILRRDILAGRLKAGQMLPSETWLQQEYGLARQTVRRAVALLRAEGLVVVRRGHGVFVRQLPEVQDFAPVPGSTVTARIPTAEERTELDLAEGVPVFLVTAPDGTVETLPADRWRLLWPSP